MGKLDEKGEYVPIDEVKKRAELEKVVEELERPPAPQGSPQQPADTDPGPDPGGVTVDEFYVETLGRRLLPDKDAAVDYRNKSAEGVFERLAGAVIERSRVDVAVFAKTVGDLVERVAAEEKKLNAKPDEAAVPAAGAEFEALPGVKHDEICTSRFDTGDLALRGRKAVSTRQYNQPLVMLDAYLSNGAAPDSWLFGEKLEFQQEWRHEGFTLGELVSSLSLLPGEELTIEVSSYQRTRQEIQTETDNTLRSQLSVEQRNTDERSCTNQTASDNGWSVSATASINYPIASASVSASAFGNSSEQAEQTRRQLSESTRRTTTDVSSRRAVKVTQTSEAGSESTTTRRLRNANVCQTVTYNFFQVIKLYDIQIRLVGDRPVLLLPGIFPRFYGTQEVRKGESSALRPTEVHIPVHLIEGMRADAVFLSRYFEVDRDLCRQISGWALRLRADIGAEPAVAIRLWAEALVVAAQYLFKIADVNAEVDRLAAIFAGYCQTILATGKRSADGYGEGKGTSTQLNTSGVYVDALRGRCTACADHEEALRYVEAMTGYEELRRLKRANELDDQEVERRKKRLDDDDLTPFEPVPTGVT